MSPGSITSQISGWETVRFEVLSTRICDLGIKMEGSLVQTHTERLYQELEEKSLSFKPNFYFTDGWGCPDRVPVIGIPFYLADERLARIEEEETGDLEDAATTMMFLRHETGHAYNYAYRLWEQEEWIETFGPFSKPYRETFVPRPTSRGFVRHLHSAQYGSNYAQKHPDEDFAETFAVWLAPRSGWRRRYAGWPALRKLEYVDRLMRSLRGRAPRCKGGRLVKPVERIRMRLVDHYGLRADRLRQAARGYVDDRLRECFPASAEQGGVPVQRILHEHRKELQQQVVRWAGLAPEEAASILGKLEARAAALRLSCPSGGQERAVLRAAALAMALAMEFAYTGRFMD